MLTNERRVLPDPDCLQHPRVPELLQHHGHVKLHRALVIVWLQTPDKEWVTVGHGAEESVQGVMEPCRNLTNEKKVLIIMTNKRRVIRVMTIRGEYYRGCSWLHCDQLAVGLV